MQAQARPRGDCRKRECVLAVDEARYEYGSQAQLGLVWPCLVCPGRVLNSCSGQLSDRLSDPFCEREAGEIP